MIGNPKRIQKESKKNSRYLLWTSSAYHGVDLSYRQMTYRNVGFLYTEVDCSRNWTRDFHQKKNLLFRPLLAFVSSLMSSFLSLYSNFSLSLSIYIYNCMCVRNLFSIGKYHSITYRNYSTNLYRKNHKTDLWITTNWTEYT